MFHNSLFDCEYCYFLNEHYLVLSLYFPSLIAIYVIKKNLGLENGLINKT
jgi:hypothetical protein